MSRWSRLAGLIAILLGLGSFFPPGPAWSAPPTGPAPAAHVSVLGAAGRPLAALVDGNRVSLQLQLEGRRLQPLAVEFRLQLGGPLVGRCTVPALGSSCRTPAAPALGWYWDVGGAARPARQVTAFVAASGRALGTSARLQVAPRPVVLVHGFNSGYQAWTNYLGPEGFLAGVGLSGYAVGDGQAPGVMNTGAIFGDPSARTNTIGENAAILGEYIAEVRRQTGAEQVDLVAHSMGGLISRYYVGQVMGERDVAQLVMLGTPQAGTDCANLGATVGMLHPATLELRPAYIQGIFNQQVTRRAGVPFFELAGTAIRASVGAPCTAAPTDLVVSVESAGAIPLHLDERELLHTDLNASREVFDDYLLPLLQASAGSLPTEPDPATSPAQVPPVQFARVYSGTVAAGGSQTFSIQIEPGLTLANFALFDPSRSLTVTVVGASGNAINLDPQTHGLVVVDDPATLVHLGYGFENPRPGPWQVTVHATPATPVEGATFALSAALQGGASATGRVSALLPPQGEPVALQAQLMVGKEVLALTAAEASLRLPGGELVSVPLELDGALATGAYTPRAAGLHGVDIVLAGTLADGQPVERSLFLAFDAQPQPNRARTIALVALVVGGVVLGLLLAAVGAVVLVGRVVRRRR